LIQSGVLPSDTKLDRFKNPFDIALAIQDRALDTGGQLIYKPEEVNYDGVLGDIPVVNGKAQPKLNVERRKYRFRILNGSTARFIQLKLSDGAEFIQIGSDSWLLPEAVTPTASTRRGTRVGEIRLGNAERADVIIDFRNAPSEVFLQNILFQDNGRRPDDIVEPGTPLMKFIVADGPAQTGEDADKPGAAERGCFYRSGNAPAPSHRDQSPKRSSGHAFSISREQMGRWAVNSKFFDHERVDANPTLGTAERWIFKGPWRLGAPHPHP
jgi:FtsP/CotA-like multicopper oxidase with cupredoxin domain